MLGHRFSEGTDMKPVKIDAVDDKGHKLFSFRVELTSRLSVQSLLDKTFIEHQRPKRPDPFNFTVSYFGYSKNKKFPGYLGYEIDSIEDFKSSVSAYWSVSINSIPASHGIDTTFPGPGDTVTLRFIRIAARDTGRNARESAIISRRRGK